MHILETIKREKIVPVVKLERVEDAAALAEALITGGINTMEITFRTAAAAAAINIIAREFPEIILGAGTIRSCDQLDQAIAAGSTFAVSPGFNPKTVEAAIERNFPIIPGVTSPSLVEQADNYNLKTLKFFPAAIAGGIPMLKTLHTVYPEIRFMPTGGLNNHNFLEYLACPNVLAIGGSWMVDPKLIAKQDFTEITRLARTATDLVNQTFK